MKFDQHIDKTTARKWLLDFKRDRQRDWQNVTVNIYEGRPDPVYITFGHYQSGADLNLSGDEFLENREQNDD